MPSRDSAASPLIPVAACVLLSGAASLGLEVVWSRLLKLVFGSTTLAVTTILVAYMLGLGIGGLTGGRLARRLRSGVRAYGLMEAAVGLYALAVPSILELYPALNRELLASLGFWPAAVVRFLLVLIVLLPPTFMMGATLPVLAAALVREPREIATRIGLLYGMNTLGAVLGVLTVTFVLFGSLGVAGTNTVCAGLDLAVGLFAAFVLAPRVARAPAPAADTASTPASGGRRWSWLLISYGVVGFTALAYEVAWTRGLSMVLGSSTYAFATMLAGFLAGIALGSLLARGRLDQLTDPVLTYARGVAVLGILGVAVALSFLVLPEVFLHAFATVGISGHRLVWLGLGLAFLVMLGPTLVLGALFPLLVRAISGSRDSSAGAVGDVYFVNTIGSALGAFSAGFLLIPLLGLQRTMAVAIALNFATAAALLLWHRPARARHPIPVALGFGAALLVLLIPPAWNSERLALGAYYRSSAQLDFGLPKIPMQGLAQGEMLYYREGINCTVSVHHTKGGIEEGGVALRINGKTDASLGDMSTQILSGHIPFWFGDKAEEVLVIGYASGITTGAVCLYEPERVDVCEIEAAVIEASHFFDDFNHRPLERANVHQVLDDGRTYLTYTDRKYDVIISEPSNPWIAGCANLFTAEFFEAAHGALEPDGRLLQWVQLYGMDEAGLRSILAALHQSFDHAYGFLFGSDSTDLMLVATDRPLDLDALPRWEALPDAVRTDLARVRIQSTADIWSLLFLLPEPLAAIAGDAEVVNTDDSMYVELNAPWHLYDDNELGDGDAAANPPALALLLPHCRGVVPLVAGAKLPAEQLGELAISYLVERSLPDAGDALRDQLATNGDMTMRSIYEAERMRLHGGGSAHDAMKLLDLAVASGGGFAAHYHRGWQRGRQKRYGEAVEDLDHALRIRPDSLAARHQRMKNLAMLGRTSEAAAACDVLIRSPWVETEHRLWAEAAVFAADAGDLAGACEQMTRYLELMPYSPREWQMLARWYQSLQRSEAALEATINERRAKANLVRQFHWLARWHERFGTVREAILALRGALEAEPSNRAAARDLERLQAR